MIYQVAADTVIVIHLLWIAFVILGFPIVLWLNNARWRLIHLAAVIWMVLMQVNRAICPLTYLEAWLKSEGRGAEVYSGKFIIETIERLIYVDSVTLEKIMYATAAYLVVIVLSFWFRPLRKKTHRQTESG
jgi:DNA integrity scanning protein DisA with diadenylate cyclase activity